MRQPYKKPVVIRPSKIIAKPKRVPKMIYAGIGARKTPQSVLKDMFTIGAGFAKEGFLLRSGGADGADKAFEKGSNSANGLSEIYLPWKEFNNHQSHLYQILPEAVEISKKHHPDWDALSQGAKKLMIRNVYQVLGDDLHQISDFVLCWTPGGKKVGGTSQAIRIADTYGVPVINMFDRTLIETIKEVKRLMHID